MKSESISEIFSIMPKRLELILNKLPESVANKITEVRLRGEMPVVLIVPGRTYFVDLQGNICTSYTDKCLKISKSELRAVFERLCDYSVYSQKENLVNGFVTMSCGNRVGIAATAVAQAGTVKNIRDVSSLNFRVSREIFGCSDKVFTNVFSGGAKSLILAGPPGSGKTTFLRDICRRLSNGYMGKYYKVAVIDERKELAAVNNGTPAKNLGINTDILDCYPKGKGIETALRVLSPDVIVCDEIGSEDEVSQIISGINSGVKFILSVHASSRRELCFKKQVIHLLRTGEFEKIVLLCFSDTPGAIKEIIDTGELNYEIHYPRYSECFGNSHGKNARVKV